jgi:uncharacterized protein
MGAPSETPLVLVKPNLHLVDVGRRRMLFHVPSSSLFELDELGVELLALLDARPGVSMPEIVGTLAGRYGEHALAETIEEFSALEILAEGRGRINLTPRSVEKFPLTTIVLNVNTGCNLSCTYCYKEDLTTPAHGRRMSLETAVQSIELLLRESPGQRAYNVVFFGGEPLTNLPLIREVVDWCDARFAQLDASVSYTMTTNATLLKEEVVDWLDAHRFGLTVSMDGTREMHDRNRRTVGGLGTYAVVRKKVEMLLARYHSRPVGCRVTLTHGITQVEAIFEHLSQDVGFAEVGFGPVTSGSIATFNLRPEEMVEVFEGMKRLGRRYVEAAVRGENFGFGNLHQLMTDIHEGNRKQLPCGAGVGLLAVDTQGGINLCHRFTGSSLPVFGTVEQGLDKAALSVFVGKRLDRSGTGCETCRIRNICSGGCYHESYAKYGDASVPSYHYCDLLRDWVDYGIKAYAEILLANPDFFDRYVSPRRNAQNEASQVAQ